MTILLVEDDENDAALFRRSYSQNFSVNSLQVVRNGIDAMAYLEGSSRYRDRAKFPFPHLVLLDLSLPGIDGFEILKWIREQPALRILPVVVLTASQAVADANAAYKLGANSFLVKPADADSVKQLFRFFPKLAPGLPNPGANSPRELGA